jgi:hypothetical protein
LPKIKSLIRCIFDIVPTIGQIVQPLSSHPPASKATKVCIFLRKLCIAWHVGKYIDASTLYRRYRLDRLTTRAHAVPLIVVGFDFSSRSKTTVSGITQQTHGITGGMLLGQSNKISSHIRTFRAVRDLFKFFQECVVYEGQEHDASCFFRVSTFAARLDPFCRHFNHQFPYHLHYQPLLLLRTHDRVLIRLRNVIRRFQEIE